VLGSPNGIGAGYFLAQHKAKLGKEVISKITVWIAVDFDIPNLLFWVTDKLEPEPEEEEPEDPPDVASAHTVDRNVVASSGKRRILYENMFSEQDCNSQKKSLEGNVETRRDAE
jgi:hypothetical protein